MTRRNPIRGVLFDLDGTLLDTAPDLVFAVNAALQQGGCAPRPADELKPLISEGAPAMLRGGLGEQAAEFEPLLERMLDIYEHNIAVHTRFFEGIEEVLEFLDHAALPWGIVTNKLSRFTNPLLQALRIDRRTGCIVSGDTTAERKPHPLPLLEACRRLRREPSECVYIGDAAQDITAGRRAGMATLAAAYGYVRGDDSPEEWGADGLIRRPEDLIPWLSGGQDCGQAA